MMILHRIKYKVEKLLLNASLFLEWPWLTAKVLLWNSWVVNSGGGCTALVLRRSVFIDDIRAMAKYSSQMRYVIFEREYFKIILYHFLKKVGIRKITEDVYHHNNAADHGKRKYYVYLQAMLPVFRKKIDFKVILAGNLGYIEQQEIARLCEDINCPFVVIHKEGMAVQGLYDDYSKRYLTRKFIGAKLLCYNENIKKSLLRVGVPGTEEEKVKVVGIPRLDAYFKEQTDFRNSKKVVFFSFFPHDKFRNIIQNQEQWDIALKRSSEFHKWIMEFAAKHSGYDVYIKTKKAKHYEDYVRDIYQNNFFPEIPNLTISSSGNPPELIQESRVVLGFNSTTLVEAIIAGRLIITPYFDDIIPDMPWDYFERDPKLVSYAKNYQGMEEMIMEPKNFIQYSEEEKADFLRERIYLPDGKASQRAEEEIISTIKDYQNANH